MADTITATDRRNAYGLIGMGLTAAAALWPLASAYFATPAGTGFVAALNMAASAAWNMSPMLAVMLPIMVVSGLAAYGFYVRRRQALDNTLNAAMGPAGKSTWGRFAPVFALLFGYAGGAVAVALTLLFTNIVLQMPIIGWAAVTGAGILSARSWGRGLVPQPS